MRNYEYGPSEQVGRACSPRLTYLINYVGVNLTCLYTIWFCSYDLSTLNRCTPCSLSAADYRSFVANVSRQESRLMEWTMDGQMRWHRVVGINSHFLTSSGEHPTFKPETCRTWPAINPFHTFAVLQPHPPRYSNTRLMTISENVAVSNSLWLLSVAPPREGECEVVFGTIGFLDLVLDPSAQLCN